MTNNMKYKTEHSINSVNIDLIRKDGSAIYAKSAKYGQVPGLIMLIFA